MRIEGIELVSKEGGRTGLWTAGQPPEGDSSSGA
jgi:hypothetical protein